MSAEKAGLFAVTGPLPDPGVTVLEASAGTGKTFTIAALVARFVAEAGVPIDRLLAVTFTRMATGELRERIRSRLVDAEEALRRRLAAGPGWAGPQVDSVNAHLAEGPDEEVERRRRRLSKALADFDAATIITTHGFCQLVLAGLGVAGRTAIGSELVEDVTELIGHTVDDVLLAGTTTWGEATLKPSVARAIGQAAVGQPGTPLLPTAAETPAGRQRWLADQVRHEAGRRLRDENQLTYDDLLVMLREALADPGSGEVAAGQLRQRYQVVLVDEFQDTDPIQWEVVSRAFGTGSTVLVLIGDPKQAIYAFRGADVFAYLDASRSAHARHTLGVNWRSDQGLLTAYHALFDPLLLGHDDIAYHRVEAAGGHELPGLEAAPVDVPLRVRVLHRDEHPRLPKTGASQGHLAVKPVAQQWVAADLAADVAVLLESDAALVSRTGDGHARGRRPVRPGDVAVLVRTNAQATEVHGALVEAGVPAVLSGADSVFATGAARQWLRLLEALERPADRGAAAAVAVGPFVGMSPTQLAGADEPEWEELHARLHEWAQRLRRHGVAPLARSLTSAGVQARVLAGARGERLITDLNHVGQLLQAAAGPGQVSPSSLRSWLGARIEGIRTDTEDIEVRSRRLDTDAEAVQVLTIYRSKGLEFPIVYCPFLWDPAASMGKPPVVFHDGEGVRRLDVGTLAGDTDWDDHCARALDEQRGEALRLLYVAMTRARHQAVLWWVTSWQADCSPLGRLLLARDHATGRVPIRAARMPQEADVVAALEAVSERAPGLVSIEAAGSPDDARRRLAALAAPPTPAAPSWPAAAGAPAMSVARFRRGLDRSWRRSSYTSMTAAAHEADHSDSGPVGSEPEDGVLGDEPAAGPDLPVAVPEALGQEAALRAVPSLMAGTPAGPELGTFVHGVLERTDFSDPDPRAAFTAAVAAGLARHPMPVGDPEALAEALAAAVTTPLGPLAPDLSLAGFGPADRLDELSFELPLAGGDRPHGGPLSAAAIAETLHRHLAPDDVLASYPDRLADPAMWTQLRGYLTGSLDLVLRLPGDRFLLVDYKTNWLGGGEPLSAWHYRRDALATEMVRAHYPLQALIYSVVLHRYLRWRLPGYRAADHLGGVAYLFLRGMSGPDTPVLAGHPCGVFGWQPPAPLIEELSDLFDTGCLA